MDKHEFVLDFIGQEYFDIPKEFIYCAVIKRPIYEFIRQLVFSNELSLQSIEDEYTPFCKDILFTAMVYCDDEILKIADLDDVIMGKIIQYMDKVLPNE
jgi:hypothetical protein